MDFKQYLREQDDEPKDPELKKDSEEAGTHLNVDGDGGEKNGENDENDEEKKPGFFKKLKKDFSAAREKDKARAKEAEKLSRGAKKARHKRGIGVDADFGEKPQFKFTTRGLQGKSPKEEEEDQDKLVTKLASKLQTEWKAPLGDPVLFERSKKGLERVIGSSRTSQLQKNKARMDLQKKRKEQIKRADKTANNPNTDLNTAIRAADASIDAKEKVKKFKAPPEKKKVKTDFGPPEKAFKD